MKMNRLLNLISNVESENELFSLIDILRLKATYIKSEEMVDLIDKAIEKCTVFNYKKLLVFLYDLRVRQFYHLDSNIKQVVLMLEEMEKLTESIKNHDCTAIFNQLVWHVERLRGNHDVSKRAIYTAMGLINKSLLEDNYVINFCKYSYAIEIWMTNHSMESAILLEECVAFFYREGFYRSLTQTIGLLGIIYSQLGENSKALDLSNKILSNRHLFENLSTDVKGIVYYFAGWGNILNANLQMAESYFDEAYKIFKPIYKDSIYFSNFLILHSYFAIAQVLQGKIDQSSSIIKEARLLLQTDYFKTNLNKATAKQVNHNLNLVNFYIISRLGNFSFQKHQELINDILKNIKDLLSDFMSLSEFILNANLEPDTLQELLEIDNFSINRVKHLIEFMLEKQRLKPGISKGQRVLNCISILESRVTTSKTTFMENVYADLLTAQQLFTLKRYAEISPLLKKYEKRLNQIEVLEMRIFMEAFIQVGAHESGDPLGPALQYMAIKKCRLYGFSRLENTLLKYLQLQHKEIIRTA